MLMLTQKIKIFLFGTIVFVSPIFQSCYAIVAGGDSNMGNNINLGKYGAVPESGDADSIRSVLRASNDLQMPVIIDANNNLFSLDGDTAKGNIIVLNAGKQPVQRFDLVQSDKAIFVDAKSSSCLSPVKAGATCNFGISYTGIKGGNLRVPVTFKIGNDAQTADFVTVNAINMPHNVFFKPNLESTESKSLDASDNQAFKVMLKNGVSVLYVGTNNGIFKNVAESNNFIAASRGLTTVDKTKDVTALQAVGDVLYAGVWYGGIFKSTDGGANWVRVGLDNLCITVLHVIDGILYAGTKDTIYKSTDGGINWIELELLPGRRVLVQALCSNDNVLYAGTSGQGVFKSTDGGANWTAVNRGLASLYITSLYFIGDALYAGTNDRGVYKSMDGGDKWISVGAEGLASLHITSLCSIGDVLYAGTIDKGVFKIMDGGKWIEVNKGLTSLYIQSLYTSDNVLYVGTKRGGIFKSIDGGINWLAIGKGLKDFYIESLCSIGDVLYLGTINTGIFKSMDGGANWNWITPGQKIDSVSVLHVIGNVLYAGTHDRRVLKSTDGGANWISVKLPSEQVNALYSINDTLYAGVCCTPIRGIFKSTDGGYNWSVLKDDINVWAFHASGGVLYVGTAGDGIYKSVDGGDNWIYVGLPEQWVRSLYSTGNILYAGAGGVFKSTDGGDNWQQLSGVSGSVVALYALGNVLYAGASSVFKSTDGGDNWQQLSGISGGVEALHSVGNVLYVGSIGEGGGLFKAVTNSSIIK